MLLANNPRTPGVLLALVLMAYSLPAAAQDAQEPQEPQGAEGFALPLAPLAPEAPMAPELPPQSPGDSGQVPGQGVVQGPDGAPVGTESGRNELVTEGQNAEADGALADVPGADPPARVGRVRVLQGRASLRPRGQSHWLDAASNRPVTPGDSLYVGKGGRARVQLGATTLYVGSETALTMLVLSQDALQVGVAQGDVYAHISELARGAFVELDVPGLTMALLEQGDYRVHRRHSGETSLTVWHGAGEARVGATTVAVHEAQRLALHGTKGEATAPVPQHAGAHDSFDLACMADLRQVVRAPALRYVSQDTVGYNDLDGHGSWQQVSDYGNVWTPEGMPAQWAPYRFGHWAFIEPWGYTWVDDASWGFAPFHYGRWVRLGNAWAWAPGARGPRPIYAPHLVTFLNGGVGNQVGWVPLGYGDPFVPGYAASYLYVRGINGPWGGVVGVGGGRPGYANCGIAGAITVMPWSAWGSGVAVGTAWGTVAVMGPHAFGAAIPPGRPPRGTYWPRAARPGVVVPGAGIMHQPVMGHGPLPLYRPQGPTPPMNGGFVRQGPAGLPSAGNGPTGYQQFHGFHPLVPSGRPPVGRFEPSYGPPAFRPGVGHPGFNGHVGAPSYYGGGGAPGGGHLGMRHGGGGGVRH